MGMLEKMFLPQAAPLLYFMATVLTGVQPSQARTSAAVIQERRRLAFGCARIQYQIASYSKYWHINSQVVC